MTASLTIHDVGGTIGAGGSHPVAPGLIEGVYEVQKASAAEEVAYLADFTAIKYARAYEITSGSADRLHVGSTTANEIIFHSIASGTVRIFVVGTPA